MRWVQSFIEPNHEASLSTMQDGATCSGLTPCPRWLAGRRLAEAGDGDGFGRRSLLEDIAEVLFVILSGMLRGNP
jgi:hypothetical protein